MFETIILGNVEECRTECEIRDDTRTMVAAVYETDKGWHINLLRSLADEELEAFNVAVIAAKQRLSHYINRMGRNPPEGNCWCVEPVADAEGRRHRSWNPYPEHVDADWLPHSRLVLYP
jgi:hypothetical protein